MLDTRKLEAARSKFYDFNTGQTNKRVSGSTAVEKLILELMNHYGVPHNGTKLYGWKKTSSRDDKTFKRDAYTEYEGNTVYAQCKFRQPNSGSDIGVALIQPYTSHSDLKEVYLHERQKMNWFWARDYKFDGISYVCLANDWRSISFTPYQESIKPTAIKVFEDWLENGYDLRRGDCFKSNGCELRFKQDSGRGGYDSDVRKIICYIPPSVLESVCHTIDFGPPEWFLEELGIS